ncbi:ArsR/SmtB family transcription factor [Ramlibacter tataouinensis]|uniref:Transcriptional regulator, ArsR family-like protein n=1 Tax=Ramlibacter tataouinensis (strain ATCC BAA-407 / DSM 14655 / LMG 21543 / TTB310) TaxID=365046 RepID=F5Y4Z9_RAMTT|nr:helix-turn-helix transcriptional regulator [Ramlibacter tataouinensis]AEG93839.1 transcriptional regulator, ArsR family-like protein [Ramlibacter tataouinensis TTB310]
MNTNQIARIAALVGEPARTGMLLALMDGRALTAHELAAAGHVTPATASRHLALLVEAGLLRLERQGRHRYHRLASAEVARVLEGIMQLAAQAAPAPRRVATGPRDAALRLARTCYDHLAGAIAVAMAERLVEDGAVVIDGDAAHVTDRAATALARLGLASEAVNAGGPGKRPHCRPCLDWGERRMHLAGRLGALLCSHCLQQGWLLPQAGSRTLAVTPRGATALRDWLGTARWDALLDPVRAA